MTSNPEDRDDIDPESAKIKDKRPRALLDLEATEVTTPPGELADAGEPEVAAADNVNAEPAADAITESPSRLDAEEARDRQPASPTWPFAGVMTHAAAGLAGGALALVLFTAFTPQLAKRSNIAQLPSNLSAIEQRIDALERASPSATAVEPRVAKIEEAQARLADDLWALTNKLGKQDFAALDARLAKLDEQVAALSAPAPAGSPQASARQLSTLTSKIADMEGRLAKPGDGGADALKSEVARLEQAIGAVKADADRNAETARVAQGATEALRGAVDALSAGVEKQFQATAKSGDIPAAVTPLAARLTTLEQNLAGVVKTETARRDTAGRILLALELASLKRAIERGEPYSRELAEVRKTSAGKLDLAAFDRSSERGAPTLADLTREFRSMSPSALDAGRDGNAGSLLDRVMAGARSVVRVRKLDHDAGDTSIEAVLARVESELADGRLGDVIGEANKLPAPARSVLGSWLDKVEARHAVDAALALVEGQLKASLTEADANPPLP